MRTYYINGCFALKKHTFTTNVSDGNCPIPPVCGLKDVLGEYTLQELLINKDDLRAVLQERCGITPQTEDVLHPGYEWRSLPVVRGTGEAPPV